MSTFYYNGVMISPVQTEAVNRQVIYDGPTYLYTRWIIRISGKFSPGATSYGTNGPAINPFRQPGNNPAWTDNSVRLMLMQPRGGLWYTADGPDPMGNPIAFPVVDLTILSLPPPGTQQLNVGGLPVVVDANYGPFPLSCNVRAIEGNRVFNVDFTIQADVNECYRVYNEPSFVLSNRWEMSHDINQHAFTTRTVRGRAIFRTDSSIGKNIRPDDYRSNFAFPCPQNFQRMHVHVRVNAAGNELYYSFTDVEQSHNLRPLNVTKIEAWSSMDQSRKSADQFIVGTIKGASRGFEKGGMIGGVTGAVAGGYKYLPKSKITIVARVWGNRMATRRDLLKVASYVLLAKLPKLFRATSLAYDEDIHVGFNLMGRFVELSATLNAGPFMTIFGGTDLNSLLQDPNAVGPPDSDTEAFMSDDIIATNPTTGAVTPIAVTTGNFSRPFPNGNGMRGTYLEACVAQTLQNVCSPPATPASITFANDGNLLTVPPSSTLTVPTDDSGTTDDFDTVPGVGSNELASLPSGSGANTSGLPTDF